MSNHILSISGLHITMLSGLAFGAITFLWRRNARITLRIPARKAATISGAITALLYACLAGLSVPTQRTLYMLLTFAVALMLSHRISLSRVLALALVIVVLLDPWAVIAPGFWLSFSAVAVITYATVNRLRLRHWLLEAANTQWSVTLGLLPFLILMFGQASIISPVANAIAIPVISLLVVPLAILGALLPIDFILHLSQSVLAACMVGLSWLANLPFATWQQAIAPVWAIALALLGITWLLLPRGFPQRWLGLLLVLPMLLVNKPQLAEGEMKMTVLDVGQGLSVVVQTATHVMVYDTGQQYNQYSDAGRNAVIPFLHSHGIQHLDALIISHDDNDHNGGMASILSELPVRWLAGSYDIALESSAKQFKCYAGQKWYWDDVKFEVLSPVLNSYLNADVTDNNRSCVIKVTSRYGSVLLPGDIEKDVEQALLKTAQNKLASDVMVAPHHGSKTSSTENFVKAVGAKHVVFTVGYLNRFNHPKPLVLSRYLMQGAKLYRSDYHGAITLRFMHGREPSISLERSNSKKYWHDEYL